MQLHKLSIGYGSIILVLFYFSTTSYGFLNDSKNNAFLRKCNNNDQDKSEERRTIISHMPKRTTTDIPESSRRLNLDRGTTVSNRKTEFNFRDTVNINTRLLDRNNNRISADEHLDTNSIRRQRTSDDRRQMVRTRRASSDSDYSPNRKNTIDDFRSAGNSLQKPTLAQRTHNRASRSNQQDVRRTQVKRSTDDRKDSRTFDRQSDDRSIGNDRVGQQQYKSQSLDRDVRTQKITYQDRNGILSTINRSSFLERDIAERRDAPNKERKNINDRRQIFSDDKIRRVSDASSRISSAPITRRSLIDRRQSSDRRELRTLETRENRRITEVSNSDDRKLSSEITSTRPDRTTKENIDDRKYSVTRGEIVADDRRRRVARVLRDVPSPVSRVSIYRRRDRRELLSLSDDRRHSLERRELVSDDRKSSEARENRRASDTQIANRIVDDRRHSSVRRKLDSDDQRRSPELTAPRQSRRIDSRADRRELDSDDRRHSLGRREFVSDDRKRSSEAREIANRIVNDRRQSSIRRELGSDDRRLSSEHTAARQMRRLTESRFDTRRDSQIPRRRLSENNTNRRELISSPRQSSQRISDDRRRLSEARGNRLLSETRSDDRGQAFYRRELIFDDRSRTSEARTNQRVSDAEINRQILNENINSRRQYLERRELTSDARRSSEARENRRVSDVRSDARRYSANINDRGQSSRRGERISDDRSSEASETRRVSQVQINRRILGENVTDRRQSSERRELISDDRRRLSEARGNRRVSESDAQVNRRINDRRARRELVSDDHRRSELKSDVRRDDRITRRNVNDHRQFSVRRKLVFDDRRQSSIRRNHPDSEVRERRVLSDTFVRGIVRKVTSPERALSHNTNDGRSVSQITSKIVTLRSNRSQRVLAERRDAPMTRRILKEVGARVSEARSETRTRQETRTRNFAEVNYLADKLLSYEVDWGNLAKSLLIAVILFEMLAKTYPKKIRFHKMSNFLACTKQKVQ